MKALVYHSLGKRVWEHKPRPAMPDPGDAIVRIATSRRGSKASWARGSLHPLPWKFSLFKVGCDVRHINR